MKKTFKAFLVALLCMLTISATMSTAAALDSPIVKVKSVTPTSVTIYWTKVSLALSYDVQRSTDAKNWTTIATGVKATEYTDSKSLTTGKSYAYRVRSKAVTSSSWSAYVVGKPLPAKVTGLKVSAANNTQVKLVWNKVSGISGYTVQYYSGGAWKSLKHVTTNSYIVSALKLGTNYHFRVAAYKTVSGKKVYGPVSDYIKTTPVLLAPTKVQLAAVNNTQMKLQWPSVKGAKGYEVYLYETGKWKSAGANTYVFYSGMKAGETYSFTVRAIAGTVKGKNSAKVSFRTTPLAPKNVAVKEATDNSVTLSWDPSYGADGYQVAYRVKGATSWTTLPLTAGTTATATGLNGLTEYNFKVRSYLTNAGVNTASSFSAVLSTKTVLPATKVSAQKLSASTDTKITWNALSGAAGYTVEKYEAFYQEWLVYSFNSKIWKFTKDITEDDVITTTAFAFTEEGKATRAETYRVKAVDANGVSGTPSNVVTAFTNDVAMNYTASTFALQQVFEWPAVSDAVSYTIVKRSPLNGTEDVATFNASAITNKTTNRCKVNLCLAPESIHSIMVISVNADGGKNTATNWITFNVGTMPILASSHKYYVSSVNSQLLYLAQAINNTKAYNDTITVKNNSVVAYSVDSLKIPLLLVDKKTPEEVEKFFKKYDDSGDMPTSASEEFNSTITFQGGTGTNEDGRTVRLKNFVEPSANSTSIAHLYNGQDYKAWKNGFESVTTKRNSDGSVTMSLVFKKETTNSPYHNGYMSSFSAADFGAGSGLEVKKLEVGKSTLNVTIDKDGILKSYVASSPYSALFAASFVTDEGVDNIAAGSLVSMEMGISGRTNFNYTFIR